MKDKNKIKKLDICLAGEGGQGVQTVGKILTEAAFELGIEVSFVPNYGVEQRGGVSIVFVRLSSEKIIYPKFDKADIIGLLSDRAVQRVDHHIGKKSTVFYNTGFIKQKMPNKYQAYDFNKLASDIGDRRAFNMLVLGKIVSYIDFIENTEIINFADKKFSKKYEDDEELKTIINQAIKKGFTL